MSQPTIDPNEISLRLTICAEFLLAEGKSMEEVYEVWKGNVGEIVGFAEFEFWYRRFQNNNFDLGNDTNSDDKENCEIGSKIDIVQELTENVAVIPKETAPEDAKKVDQRFNIQNVPIFFRNFINGKTERISLYLTENSCSMTFDDINVQIEKYGQEWVIKYKKHLEQESKITSDPEKSIIDHLYFVLRDPKLKLRSLGIQNRCVLQSRLIDFERLNVMLQEMFNDSWDHQLSISSLFINKLAEDTFISLLNRVKPKTLASISMEIYGNKKMKEILETEQWKHARNICSTGDSSLRIDDVLHCKHVLLCCDNVTPEDVIRVRDLFLEKSSARQSYTLKTEHLNYDKIKSVLQSPKNLDPGISSHYFDYEDKFYFQFLNLSLTVTLFENEINQLTKMMKQLTVPYQEIENRLAICCEFLLDRNRPIKNAYNSLMGKVGMKLMEYSEFDYWFKRFQNNQFDLGYDTSLDSKEISEIQDAMSSIAIGAKDAVIIEKEATVKVQKNVRFSTDEDKEDRIEAKIDKEEAVPVVVTEKNDEAGTDKTAVIPKKIAPKALKNADYQFDVQDVPVIFQELVQKSMSSIRTIFITCGYLSFSMSLNRFEIRFERNAGGVIEYGNGTNKKITSTTDPEKSIIDHLWFVLRDPNLTLKIIGIQTNFVFDNPLIDFERILSSMLGSFDRRLCINELELEGLNEDTFISFLKRVEPKKLASISFDISWKEKGNYQKMKEIVEMDQWKQANRMISHGISPLTVDDILPFKMIYLCCEKITPEDVVRVRDHFSESPDKRYCLLTTLRFFENKLHYDEFENVLQSKNLHSRVVRSGSIDYFYTLPDSSLKVTVSELDREIVFAKSANCNRFQFNIIVVVSLFLLFLRFFA